MDSSLSSGPSILSIGPRAVAQLITGVAALAVGVLFFALFLDRTFPGVDSLWQHLPMNLAARGVEPRGTLATAVLLLLGAYVVGVVMDGVATLLWTAVARKDDDRDPLRDWMKARTEYEQLEMLQEQGETPWLDAQRWIWKSPRAHSEFGDLRLRLMLGKDLALVSVLGSAVCLAGVVSMGFGVPASVVDPLYGEALGIPALVVAGLSFVVLVLEATALTRGLIAPPERDPKPATYFAFLLATASLVTLVWGIHGPAKPISTDGWWLVIGVILSPFIVFAFVHVRLEAQRLYNGLVADTCCLGPPE